MQVSIHMLRSPWMIIAVAAYSQPGCTDEVPGHFALVHEAAYAEELIIGASYIFQTGDQT